MDGITGVVMGAVVMIVEGTVIAVVVVVGIEDSVTGGVVCTVVAVPLSVGITDVCVVTAVQPENSNKKVVIMLITGTRLPDFNLLFLIPLYPHNSGNFQEYRGRGGVEEVIP